MSQITIPGLPNNPAPPDTVLFEISNAGVSENVTLASIIVGLQNVSEKNQPNGYPGLDVSGLIASGQIPDLPQSRIIDLVADLALKEDAANKGAVSGYAGIDASKQLLLGNFPPGNALEFLRRNAGNTALEFAVVATTPQTPIAQDIDYATFSDFNKNSTTFNEIATPPTPPAGEVIFWAENLLGTSALRYKASDGIPQTILENQVLAVRNTTGGTLFKGEAVYITGSNTQRITVDRALADDISTAPAIGVMEQDLPNNTNGFVLINGSIFGLNTSTFTAGDAIFLSSTVPGGLQNTAPLHPDLSQIMGVVLISNPSAGVIGIVTGQITGAEQGTEKDIYKIGSGLAGAKRLDFVNDFTMSILGNPTANRTINMPDASDTLVGKITVDVLQNKTIDADLNTITNIGSSEVVSDIITGQALKSTAVDADEVLLYDSVGAALKRTTVKDFLEQAPQTPIAQNVDYASFDIFNLGTLNTHTIPGGTDTFAMLNAVQALTNKTIDFANNTVTATFAELNTAISDATIVDLNAVQTLTNKTLDASLNTLTGVSNITGLGPQVQALQMVDNNIEFGIITGTRLGTTAAQKLAFYGNTPIIQPIDGAGFTNNVTVGGTSDQVDNFTDLTTYANDAATIRNDIYQLARKVKIITDNLRNLGLES